MHIRTLLQGDSRDHYHYNCSQCDADCLVQGIPFKDQTQMTLLKDAGIHSFSAKTNKEWNRSLQHFDKPKTTVPGQLISSRPHYSQPARHVGDARRGPGQRW